jgi:adenine-specific DNA-methyltransferase
LEIMNWKVSDYLMQQISTTNQNGYFEYKPVHISQIPIPVVSKEDQDKVGTLVEEISSLKSLDPAADTASLETEIDQLVYALYGLTAEEIALVEVGVPLKY